MATVERIPSFPPKYGRVCARLAVLLLTLLGSACRRSPAQPATAGPQAILESAATVDFDELRPQVAAFCGDCHATPRADRFPRDAWHKEVERGYNFYYESGRGDLTIPVQNQVVAFFREQAPKDLPVEIPSYPGTRLRFERSEIDWSNLPQPPDRQLTPAVSHLLWMPAENPTENDWNSRLLICDMRIGPFAQAFPKAEGSQFQSLASVGNPAHAEPTDLDGDGKVDFVVADLGSFLPEDHDRGRVLWLRPNSGSQTCEVYELAGQMGRVADVQPGDFDNDGDVDLVVAEFGWLKTGSIRLLTNRGLEGGIPQFDSRVVDQRHGAIHVPAIDINHDGLLDFIALISQEYETVEAFVNQPDGSFRNEVLFAADDPAFGSSGIQLTDLDGDGDTDVLYTNGDTLDSYFLKPYHAVHWIENRGDSRWQERTLVNMPGVMRAIAGDIDGDGDQDVMATAFITKIAPSQADLAKQLPSILWLEQVSPGRFDAQILETGNAVHVALELGDFDQDGDLDFAVGDFRDQPASGLTIWWNQSDPSE